MPAGDRPQVTGWYLNDVPGEFIYPFVWSLTRGTDPHIATIAASDDRFEELENPVSLTVVAPDPLGRSADVVTFENLYILERRRAQKGLYFYVLGDVRWALGLATITRAYNVRPF